MQSALTLGINAMATAVPTKSMVSIVNIFLKTFSRSLDNHSLVGFEEFKVNPF